MRESCPLTYNISPFGGDKREGRTGLENLLFKYLLPQKEAGGSIVRAARRHIVCYFGL